MLKVRDSQIIDSRGQPIRLRGTCVGGWLNMEDFMAGFPGSEHLIRRQMERRLGAQKAQFLFDRWLDYFFTEMDVRFIAKLGANAIRLPFNYRHLESDAAPFRYLEKGFARLQEAVEWCARHGLYAILDLHAVQGWQNSDWHCDNAGRGALFWEHPHFQDRFIALWEELARRFKGNAAVAGYDLMNEPVTNAPAGRFSLNHPPDFEALNRVYRRAVEAIRKIDPDHIIFLEGDGLAQRFSGMEAPFAVNLVYSSHPYSLPCFLQGEYPGPLGENREVWNHEKQLEMMLRHEGTEFAMRHRVPLWMGEFGILFGPDEADHTHRVRALADQIAIIEQLGAHWTTWNYKDIGRMGWLRLDPESAYMKAIGPIMQAKGQLMTDSASTTYEVTPIYRKVKDLARAIDAHLPSGLAVTPQDTDTFLHQSALNVYVNHMLQPAYVDLFAQMNEEQIDRAMQSFSLENCLARHEFLEMLAPLMRPEPALPGTMPHM